jgi:hypothetical protein
MTSNASSRGACDVAIQYVGASAHTVQTRRQKTSTKAVLDEPGKTLTRVMNMDRLTRRKSPL